MKHIFYLFIIFLTIMLTGCNYTPYYYGPNGHNVPLFTSEDQVHLSASASASSDKAGFEFQGGYSPAPDFAILGSFCKLTKDNGNNYTSLYEAGCGYYTPLRKHLVFETYGVLGLGQTYNNSKYENKYYSVYDGGNPPAPNYLSEYSKLDFQKIYIQPSLALTSSAIDLIFSIKVGVLHFDKIDYYDPNPSNDSYNPSTSYKLEWLKKNKLQQLFETAYTLRCGYKALKLQMQFSYGNYSTGLENLSDKGNFNMGLILMLPAEF